MDTLTLRLPLAGVVGLIGGDEAVSALAAIHVYENTRWLGWYISPGSYQIAKRCRLLAKSRLSDSLSPGIHTDPFTLLELGCDGWKGPKFRAAHSRTVIKETDHLAALFMKECTILEGKDIKGRKTRPVTVTVAELSSVPDPQMYPKRVNTYSPLSSIPISVSLTTCITCGVLEDWYSFSLILLGILTNGICCLIIGSAKLVFTHPDPGKGPPGDGILSSDQGIVLLKGAQGAVNSVTCGRFSLCFSSERQYQLIRWCSAFLDIQTIAQILLIPQGSLFGQLMFLTSLGVSWIYNLWLSSLHTEILRDLLFHGVLKKPVLTKYIFGTRTTMAAFVLHLLNPVDPIKILDELLPNDTRVWRKWKKTIARRFRNREKFEFVGGDWEFAGFSQQEKDLLKTLYQDAEAGYHGYVHYSTSCDSTVDRVSSG